MRHAQRGAALLLAMLTVTLVATFAATALWQQWRAVEVEQSERARSQSAWILVGALDWARLILREDARASGSIDHLAEPWAVPLQESRMSTFLAAENGVNQGGDEGLPEVFLSGSIVDLQSRMNVANLVDATSGELREAPLKAFTRLFELLGLPQAELQAMAENLRRASQKQTDDGADVPLRPERFDQLVWLGVSPATLRVLEPHVTLLPRSDTKINLNTASAQVIAASSEDLNLADAQRLVQARTNSPLRDPTSAAKILSPDGPLATNDYSVNSGFFEVNGRLRMEGTVVSERSLVHRNNNVVTTIWRQRVAGERQP